VEVIQQDEERFSRCASCWVIWPQLQQILQRQDCPDISESCLHSHDNMAFHTVPESRTFTPQLPVWQSLHMMRPFLDGAADFP